MGYDSAAAGTDDHYRDVADLAGLLNGSSYLDRWLRPVMAGFG